MTIIFFFFHSKLVNKDKSFFIYSSAVCVFFTNETFRQLIFSKAFSKTLTCMEPIKTSTNIFLSSSPPPFPGIIPPESWAGWGVDAIKKRGKNWRQMRTITPDMYSYTRAEIATIIQGFKQAICTTKICLKVNLLYMPRF